MDCTFRYCTSLTSVVIVAQGENGEIYPGSGHEGEYIFEGCTNLQHIYGTAESCCKLIKGLVSAGFDEDAEKVEPLNGYVDRGPASVLPEVTPDYTVEFSGLDTLLQGLEANTVATPYKIKVTGLTGEDCYDNVNYGTSPLGLVLQNNSTKYVDLSPTTIIPYETQGHSLTLERAFKDCTSLIVAPYVPVTTDNAFEIFSGCSSLKSATIYLTNNGTSNKYLYAAEMFYNTSIESVRFVSPTTYIDQYTNKVEFAMLVDSDYYFIQPTTNLNAIYVDTYEAKLALYKWAANKTMGDWSYINMDSIIVDPITNS
ncbi:MAG: hypothetical protein J6W64_03005 [Bacilli bacterium]|nr:hypothetical protein [Bacilli bacterium]